MARWADLEQAEPEFASAVRRRLEAGVHKTLATLRADGSPRISGIEAFLADGDLWFGSMPRARKALDLRRDPRFALHSASADPPDWDGDAKLSGTADEVTDPERRRVVFAARGEDAPSEEVHVFRAEIADVTLIALNDARDRLLIDHWRPGRGITRTER